MTPRMIRQREAPGYLGMNKNLFAKIVRPHLIEIPIGKQGIAYDRFDLDAWADEYKRCNGRPAKTTGVKTWGEKELQVSSNLAKSGTSTSSSGVNEFASLLDSVRSQKQKSSCGKSSKRSASRKSKAAL